MVLDPDLFQKERTNLAHDRTDFAKERTLFAAERTFSAWIRTGLAGLGGGLVLIRFLPFSNPSKLFVARLSGGLLLLWGLMVIIFALRSYNHNLKKYRVEPDPLSKLGVSSIGFVLILICILVFILAEN
ncbi:hypothetical protein PHSC3_001395 [Chlamydiales bacterium STE3]|nr:hypothetical protein PHSC3_001395 [Chlamydiales bacterium STE3]